MGRLQGYLGAAAALSLGVACSHTSEEQQREQAAAAYYNDQGMVAQRLALWDETQINLAQLAVQRAENPQVRALAGQVSQDHQRHLDQLDNWAQSVGIPVARANLNQNEMGTGGSADLGLPPMPMVNSNDQDFRNAVAAYQSDRIKLMGLSGPQFDSAYLEILQRDTSREADLVKGAQGRFQNNPQLSSLLAETRGVLSERQRRITTLEQVVSQEGSASQRGMGGSGSLGGQQQPASPQPLEQPSGTEEPSGQEQPSNNPSGGY